MDEQHLTVSKTARFFTLGNSVAPADVWFVLHGYSQLASDFARYFEILDSGHALVVAPEALSRFYVRGGQGRYGPKEAIGASWMTREDRLAEIEDYVDYLNALHDHVLRGIDRERITIRVLGFSQGVDTACRWIDRGRVRADHLVLWGGFVPEDVDVDRERTPFESLKISIVVGTQDAVLHLDRIAELESRVERFNHEFIRFDGGHHLNKNVISKLATSTL